MNVVIADDSAIIRAIFTQKFDSDSDINVVASVSTGRKAIDAVIDKEPDIVITDVDMPEMNGIDAARFITEHYNVPVIVMSENQTDCIKAKVAKACDFFLKPSLDNYNEAFFSRLKESLCKNAKGEYLKGARSDIKADSDHHKFKILCIGASTGGPTAVANVLKSLGSDFKLPVIYSQHIEVGDDENMAQWFNKECPNIRVKLADDGEVAQPGTVYMARADKHLVIDFLKPNKLPVLRNSNDPPERFLRPSVNVMFRSASYFYRSDCLGVLMTGMGRDGADGCRTILDNGGYTIVEDKSTCVVFGMPAAAIETGGAAEVLPRNQIAERILSLVGGNNENR